MQLKTNQGFHTVKKVCFSNIFK